ncbi:MAG: hypothetical protein KF762_17195 [Acidobacteria bacterium]|nr:hypothetical protein [Acidobacteriota bacterium]
MLESIPDVWLGVIATAIGAIVMRLLDARIKDRLDKRAIMRDKIGELFGAIATVDGEILRLAIHTRDKGPVPDPDAEMLRLTAIFGERIAPTVSIYIPRALNPYYSFQTAALTHAFNVLFDEADGATDIIRSGTNYLDRLREFRETVSLTVEAEGVTTRISFAWTSRLYAHLSLLGRMSARHKGETQRKGPEPKTEL